MNEPRLAVVGCGSIGKRHLRNLLALGADVIGASDPDPVRRVEVSDELGIECFHSTDGLFDKGPDAVVICAPTALHLPIAIQAANRGIHLFIEKPLSRNSEGVGELGTLVRDQQLVTLVGCNMRWHPGPRGIKGAVEAGKIGRVLGARFEVGYYLPSWHPDEDYRKGYSARAELGGGVILDAIHEIDLIRWIVGDAREVSCVADKVSSLEIDTEDLAEIVIRFDNGAIGGVHLDYLQRNYHRACRVIGEKGTLEWDWTNGRRQHSDGEWSTWQVDPWDTNDMYLAEMKHFLACLAGEEIPEQDVVDAQQVLNIALAAKESALTGARVAL